MTIIPLSTTWADQVVFWEDLYRHTMIEFLYVNHLDVETREIRLDVQVEKKEEEEEERGRGEAVLSAAASARPIHTLVPLGGGKDSIVVYENLKRQQQEEEEEEEEGDDRGGQAINKISWCHVSDGYGEFHQNKYLREVVAISEADTVW